MKDLTYLVSPSEKGILEHAGDRPPLGLLYISKELEKHGHPTRVYDLNHDDEEVLLYDMAQEKPTMTGVSCLTTPLVKETQRLLKRIHEYSPTSRLVVGGYHPSVMPNDFVGLVDNVVIGEGEYAAECLVDDINGFIKNGRPANLTALGRPDRTKLTHSYSMNMDDLDTATMLTSRGCPNACIFCGNRRDRVRTHTLEDIGKELDDIKALGHDAVYFMDDVFTLDKERAKKIATMVKDRQMQFRCTTRANYLDADLVKHFSKNNCYMVSMGIESGNNEVLRGVGKNQKTSDIRDAVKLLGAYDIKTKGFFIMGLPGDNKDTMQQTIDFSLALRKKGLTSADFYPLVPYPGTRIWDNPDEFGLKILSKDYDQFLQTGKVGVETEGSTRQEIQDKLDEAQKLWSIKD